MGILNCIAPCPSTSGVRPAPQELGRPQADRPVQRIVRTFAPAPLKESVVASPSDRLLTPREVASVFRVDQKTVTKWATAGRIKGVRTPGGQWRFRESDVREALR